MAKLTKAQTKAHQQALAILEQDILSDEDKVFVLENYHEGANNNNGECGAFFTPLGMADGLAHDALGDACGRDMGRVIDLCAGIGALAYALHERYKRDGIELVCVELNPEYVRVGKKIVPEATWICGDVLDTERMLALGQFETAVSNPPFGRVRSMKDKSGFNYTGSEAEFKVMDIASVLAKDVAFIIPQGSANFRYSNHQGYEGVESKKANHFMRETGIELTAGMGYDTTCEFMGRFKDTAVVTEFVHAETDHIWAAAEPVQATLF